MIRSSKKHIILFALSLNIILFVNNKAQTITVLSSSGKPVSEAVVQGGNNYLVTDKNGTFPLTPFLSEDSLIISHVAFKTKKVSVKKLKDLRRVILINKTFKTNVVKVTSKKNNLDKEQLEITPEVKAKFNTVSKLLKNKSTIKINSYGGEGSLTTVSSRGMSSDNTLVLFNETKVNDLRSGSFDFSLIGLNSIDEVEYFKNGVDGFSAAGGVLKLTSGRIPNSNNFLFGAKADNLFGQSYYFKTGLVLDNNSLLINIERSFSPNHYKYEYAEKTRERYNADYSRSFFSATFNSLFNKGFVKLYSHYSTMNNGLPGFIAANNYNSSHARSITKNILTTANLFYRISKNLSFRSSFGFNNQRFTIADPFNEFLFFSKEEKSVLNEYQFNNVFDYHYNNLNIQAGANLLYGTITLPKIGANPSREQLSANRSYGNLFVSLSRLFTSLPFFKKVKPYVNGSRSLSNEIFSDDKKVYSYYSYKFGLIAAPEFVSNIAFEFYFADNFREPNFTEIYYSSIYSNTKLKGERYKTLNFSIDFSPLSNFSSNLSLYYIDGKDKIVWLPTRLALQIPRNFRSIESMGLEFTSNLELLDKKLGLNFIYVYNSVTNTYFAGAGDETYNKQLVYSPRNRLTFGATINLNSFSVTSNLSYTDKSYYTNDNNPRFTLPAYFLADFSFSHSFNFSGYKSRVTLNIYNVFNTNYFVIQSYPMPLRSFTVDFQFGVF